MQIELIRRMPAWKKLAIVDGLNETVKTLAITGIKQCHPEATPEQIQRMLAEIMLVRNLPERSMTMQAEVTRVTLLVTQAFEQLGVTYAIGGSLASSLHGVMRSTLDVDVVADMHLEHIQPLVAALSKEFYADDEMMRDAIEHRSSFNLIHYETAFKVDVFIQKSRAFDRVQLERRRTSVITIDPEQSVYVTSPEDVILSKLEWYRMGGEVSDRHGATSLAY
ncbi:MAG TPA: hypothetical protein VK880_04090 [Anaerolineales bacterium]|nr:hypothetical protein [Anaerolineales bacterium]